MTQATLPNEPLKPELSGQPGLRLGIMGGTFDPVHLGHLRAAEEMSEMFRLDKTLFIPAARPVHKRHQPRADYHDRLAMLEAAVKTRPGFEVSPVESLWPGPSYSLNTLSYLQACAGGAEMFFLIGMDAFLSIDQWYKAQKLFALTNFVVFCRAGVDIELGEVPDILTNRLRLPYQWQTGQMAFSGPGLKNVYFRPGCGLEISSTDLRNRLARGLSIRYLVTNEVLDYINARSLYAKP